MNPRSTPYNHFWSMNQDRMVFIASVVGQAQYLLHRYSGNARRHPREWLLLCRFADTIEPGDSNDKLQQLERFARNFDSRGFETLHGYVYPPAAREIEREIVPRLFPESAAGHDMTPAMRLLEKYEEARPAFSQPERNLLLMYAFCTGDYDHMEEIACMMAAKEFARRKVIEACGEVETAQLEWAERETLDGLTLGAVDRPHDYFDAEGCEFPGRRYPRFAFYPAEHLPREAKLLQTGAVLFPCPSGDGWWRSGLRRVDQTFTAPHHFKRTGGELEEYEYADMEYQSLFPQKEQGQKPKLQMGGL